jgi:glutamate-1-semialdehyde aminotransferase
MSKNRYEKSEELLDLALKLIPLGSQTFSKSITQLPFGVSPYFVKKAKGAYFWDVDNNQYLDFSNALASVTLGYCDSDVDSAVKKQMECGVTFSLPHTLEVDVAKMLIDAIPCAEQVRFAKNGTDATSGAVRVARAFTGKERVAVCGYHGWQDWYIGSTTKNLGVPKCVQDLTHVFSYNNIDSLKNILEKYPDEFAAVIMEPMSGEYPKDNFLEKVKELAHNSGALLIFDETVTGFRVSYGGAQELFGVTPDLATFGKGLANGYPLSALVGKEKYMVIMKDIFFSGTFGGETLSLAAAKAVLEKIKREKVLEHLSKLGGYLHKELDQLLSELDMLPLISYTGHPSWSFLIFKDKDNTTSWELKTFFMQEMFKRGIFTIGAQTISYEHNQKDIDKLLHAYKEVFSMMKDYVKDGVLQSKLDCETLKPLFSVR